MKIRHMAALAATALLVTSASANDFSYNGTFKHDNSKAVVVFKVVAPGTVTFKSFGYAGGVNAAGQTIGAGGFDPIVSLYDPNGDFVDDNDDGPGGADSFLTAVLNPGKYRLYVTQYANFGPASVRSDTFAFDGQPNFANNFIDFNGNQRTGNWAVDVLNVSEAKVLSSIGAVPEPSTWAMMISGFGLVGAAARRRKRVALAAA